MWSPNFIFTTVHALLKLVLFLSCGHRLYYFLEIYQKSYLLVRHLNLRCLLSFTQFSACLWVTQLASSGRPRSLIRGIWQTKWHIFCFHFQKKAAPHYHYWFCKHVSAGKYLSDNIRLMKLGEMTSLPLTFRTNDSGRTNIYH